MIKVLPDVARPPTWLARIIEGRAPGVFAWMERSLEQSSGGGDLVVTSWWRSRAHNSEVGGAPLSQHLLGTAFDVRRPPPGFVERARAHGWIVIGPYADGHVHVQAYPGDARLNVLFREAGL